MNFTPKQKEDILFLYCIEGVSAPNIAKKLELSRWSVETFLNKHNIIKRRAELRKEAREVALKEMAAKGYTISEMAKELDLAEITIRKGLKEYGIDPKKIMLDKEKELLISYLRAGLTINDIAKKMNVSPGGVQCKIRRAGIDAIAERKYYNEHEQKLSKE